ncbi:hypothetical protein ACFLTR_01835 [Chloroflexota bacterium]
MQKYYSNLVVLEDNHNEGVFCRGRGWVISFESNPSSHIVTGNEPAKEIVVYTQSADRAQHVIDLVLAAYCLYIGEILTSDPVPVFQNRAQTIDELEEQLLAGGGHSIGVYGLPVSCLIAAKASRKNIYQYAIFKNLLSCRTVPLGARSLDPQGDWEPGKIVSVLPGDHVFNASAITLGYSVLEELSLDIRASTKVPSRINGRWNPQVKKDLQERLAKAGINLSDPILWHLRDTPTRIERTRKPPVLQKTEWAGFKVRDVYLDIVEAIAYASWLRSKISAHRLSALAKSLTVCDVANVQHLARRLLLETLGFWRYFEATE